MQSVLFFIPVVSLSFILHIIMVVFGKIKQYYACYHIDVGFSWLLRYFAWLFAMKKWVVRLSTLSVLYPELFWSWYTGLRSQTQTLKCSKVLISGVTFCQCSLLQSQESNVLSYSECKIAKNFQGFAPGPLWGGLTVLPQTPRLHNGFSPCYTHWKNWHPQKIAGNATDYTQVVQWTRQQSKYLSSVMSCPFFPTGCRIHCHQCSTQWTCFQGRFAELENSDNFRSNAPYIPIVQYHTQSTLQVLVCQSKFFCLHQCICCIVSFLLFFLFSLCFQYLLMIQVRASTNNFVFWCMVHTQTECAPNDKTDS